MGIGLFVAVATVVIPTNYQNGILQAVITTILLGMFLLVGLGSAWTFVMDILRLYHANEHIIVITPDDFVKQETKLHPQHVERAKRGWPKVRCQQEQGAAAQHHEITARNTHVADEEERRRQADDPGDREQ